ncbi:hypothetical protein [Streptomyces sp. RTd22]|uniref:hypothetical protein n=1 Tax=Streptomyces sp. RTd22 TaxID=1841249 RepID=UPI0018FEE8BD|nr:hypothetical protein [Streptomyces sp. RTd22]
MWRCDDRTDLADLPVIFSATRAICGSRPAICASCFGCSPLRRTIPRIATASPPARERYLAWLERNFGTGDAEGEVLAEYARRFADWVAEFASEDLLDQVVGALGLDRRGAVTGG